MNTTPRTLDDYMALDYPIQLIADPDGGYTVVYPDLPGCLTQVETLDEVPAMAREARELWLEGVLASGQEVPLPSYPEEYSGKFNVRIPRSLHRQLVEGAEREEVSLNQYVTMLLARGDTQARLEGIARDLEALMSERFQRLEARLHQITAHFTSTPLQTHYPRAERTLRPVAA